MQPKHSDKEIKKIKGSTIIIIFMYLTWVAYIGLQIWCFANYHSFLPNEITYCTAGLFITETAALAKLKMAKEGTVINTTNNNNSNNFLSKVGLNKCTDFDEEINKLNEQNSKALEDAKKSLQNLDIK